MNPACIYHVLHLKPRAMVLESGESDVRVVVNRDSLTFQTLFPSLVVVLLISSMSVNKSSPT